MTCSVWWMSSSGLPGTAVMRANSRGVLYVRRAWLPSAAASRLDVIAAARPRHLYSPAGVCDVAFPHWLGVAVEVHTVNDSDEPRMAAQRIELLQHADVEQPLVVMLVRLLEEIERSVAFSDNGKVDRGAVVRI